MSREGINVPYDTGRTAAAPSDTSRQLRGQFVGGLIGSSNAPACCPRTVRLRGRCRGKPSLKRLSLPIRLSALRFSHTIARTSQELNQRFLANYGGGLLTCLTLNILISTSRSRNIEGQFRASQKWPRAEEAPLTRRV